MRRYWERIRRNKDAMVPNINYRQMNLMGTFMSRFLLDLVFVAPFTVKEKWQTGSDLQVLW